MLDLSATDRKHLIARIHRLSTRKGVHLIYPPSDIVLQRRKIRYRLQARRIIYEDHHGPLPHDVNLRKFCDEPDCIACCAPIDPDRRWVNEWVERYHAIDPRTKRWRPRILAKFQREFRDYLVGRLPNRLSPIERIRRLLAIDEQVKNAFGAPGGNIATTNATSPSDSEFEAPPAEVDRCSDEAGS
ncbi:hypothetical protein [Constrictibacter sp. MBR-5]|uniref:hypothetical protein n=1 Tax=Constrictibacter sp. MBR-5 TaxID=3156467 RepID=UPI003392E6E8